MSSELANPVQHAAGSSERIQAGEACPICLEPVSGEAFLDQCFHRFCYHCILQWSEMVLAASLARSGNPKRVAPLECPYCKMHYTSIIHDFVSGTRYQRDFLLASDGSQFRLSEAHRRRRAVYAAELRSDALAARIEGNGSEVAKLGFAAGSFPGGPKTRNVRGVVKGNKWLRCWVRRELQALMQEEDVEMVTHHVVGVVESMQKRARGSHSQDTSKSWHESVAAAARPFVFEHAEQFAGELWRFLDAGIDIAFYDQEVLESTVGVSADRADARDVEMSSVAPQETRKLEIFDEDVEGE